MSFKERATELNITLEEAMTIYLKYFDEVYNFLYPKNDPTKSKKSRENRQKAGENYFSPEEIVKIRSLAEKARFMGAITDSKIFD